MAQYIAPLEILPIFDSSIFNTPSVDVVTTQNLLTGFLPTNMVTGTETFGDLTVANLTFSGTAAKTLTYTFDLNAGTITSNNIITNTTGTITTDILNTQNTIEVASSINNSVLNINGVHNFTGNNGSSILGAITNLKNAVISTTGAFKISTLLTHSIEMNPVIGTTGFISSGTNNIANMVATPFTDAAGNTISKGVYPRLIARGSFSGNAGGVFLVGTNFGISSIVRVATGVYTVTFTTSQTVSQAYMVYSNTNYVGIVQVGAQPNGFGINTFTMTFYSMNNAHTLTDPSNGCDFTVQYFA